MTEARDIPVVNHHDRFLRWATRGEVHTKKLIHRSINVLVFSSDRKLLLQLRHRDKSTQPACWDLSCSGHVERCDHDAVDEGRLASDRAVTRELEEELGISAQPVFLMDLPPITNVTYEYMRLYVLQNNGPFQLQEDEVEAVQWVNIKDLRQISPCTRQLQWLCSHPILQHIALSTVFPQKGYPIN